MIIKKINNFDLLQIKPKIIKDKRGYFFEVIKNNFLFEKIGKYEFKQENESLSVYGTFRGLHIQVNQLQGKLIRVVEGEIFDICLDCRQNSKTFGKNYTIKLNSKINNMLWIPPGYAHGFLVLSKLAKIIYKCTEYYSKKDQVTVDVNDKKLKIQLPLLNQKKLILSNKDNYGLSFNDFSNKYKILK